MSLVFLIILIGILFLWIKAEKAKIIAEKKAAVAREQPPTNVVVLEVKPSTISDRLNLPGIVEPWTKLQLLSLIHGEIIAVPVTEGDHLKKDQVIARIDPDEYRIALDAARASYKLAVANLKRIKSLFEQELVPLAELEKFETQVSTEKATMEKAELQLSRCVITAPMSGVIQKLDAEVGLLLNVGDPVAELLEIDQVKAVVGIPESDVDAVRKINEIDLTIQALGDRKFTGRKHFLASAPESFARLYRLELAITNRDKDILPGMFIRANVVKKVVENGVAIPLYSIISRDSDHYVFIEKNGIAERQLVETGIQEGWLIQVTKGLATGSRVIVEGHRSIDSGHKVNVVKVLTKPSGLAL